MAMTTQDDEDIFSGVEEKPQSKTDTTDPKPAPAQGGSAEKVELLLNKLFSSGHILKVNVGFWRAKKKLKPVDLGLGQEEVPPEIVSLGQKRLIKKSSFQKIEQIQNQAYALVEAHSHESWIPGLRFMTKASAAKVREKLNEIKKEFHKAAEEFVTQYPELKEQMLKEFPGWAPKLEPFYPSPEAVRASFKFTIHEFNVTVVQKMAGLLEDAKVSIKQNLMNDLNQFLTSTVKDVRNQFIEELTAVQEKLAGGEKVHAKTVKKIHEMIEQAKSMDFIDDKEFLALLDKFKAEFNKDTVNEPVFKDQVSKSLQTIIDTASDAGKVDEVVEQYKRSIIV